MRRSRLALAVMCAIGALTTLVLPLQSPAAAAACRPGYAKLVAVADGTGSRPVWIHRPAGGDNIHLPVVYFLHGFPGNALDFTRARLGTALDNFTCATGIRVVAVAPDGNAAGKDTEWGDAVSGSYDLETFVTSTLINAVEGRSRRPASLRAIAGFSMGGFGAMSLALRHRNLYGQVASLAGYFDIDDRNETFGGNGAAHQPEKLISRARGLSIYLAAPRNDGDPITNGQTLHFNMLLGHAHIYPTVAVTPGGHTLSWLAAQLPNTIAFFGQNW